MEILMDFLLTQSFNSLSFAAIIFLLASGLSIVFGVMEIINMAHATYYLLGGYVGLTIMRYSENYLLSIICGVAVGAIASAAMERLFLMALDGKMMGQLLVTVGFMFIFQDLCLVIWGGDPQWINAPRNLTGILRINELIFPKYRIFLILLAIIIAAGLWWIYAKTRFGIMLRATVDDREMAQGVGINFTLISIGAFIIGGGLAGLSGVVGNVYLTVAPGVDLELLPYAFLVVILGGLGSLRGVLVGSALVGFVDNFGKVLFPEISYFILFAAMAIILAIRPKGLFGR